MRQSNCIYKVGILVTLLGMLFILLNAYITIYYTYLYLYILFIFIIYTTNYHSIILLNLETINLYSNIFYKKYNKNQVYTRDKSSNCNVFHSKISNQSWLHSNTVSENKSEQI